MSEPKNINVSIPNVISWFEESEQCMLHNHAELIPTTKSVILDLITKIKHASMTNSDYDAIVLKESIETLRKVVQNSYDKPLSNSYDDIHNYATLISKKSIEAENLRQEAKMDDNYDYWDGYLAALDFAMDSLPDYNN